MNHINKYYSLSKSDFIIPKRFSFLQTTSNINHIHKRIFYFCFLFGWKKNNVTDDYAFCLNDVFLFTCSPEINASERNTEFICENSKTSVSTSIHTRSMQILLSILSYFICTHFMKCTHSIFVITKKKSSSHTQKTH